MNSLYIYNNLTRKKELFNPITENHIGMYVCGPTVYSDVHLGNVRTFMAFDIVYRYLKVLGFKVRYVRNITDVGHLVNDADDGDDKIAKQARLLNLEPMEVVQKYTNQFREVMKIFNLLPPSIEPTATGHIIEQIESIQKILDNGYAYVSDGSVYFDIEKYNQDYNYGELSGRNIEDLISNTRVLDGQDSKRNPLDFALWKKAEKGHIMQWNSPWGKGFPGWHLECSVMSTKYLGDTFDIHGGGMDLKFPHHECEVAQNYSSKGKNLANYWMHSNMLTVNGQKMSKSVGNVFNPDQLISGNHPLLEKGFHPMVIRFFILQTHYSSTLDFSNEALKASEKGFERLNMAYSKIENLPISKDSTVDIQSIKQKCYDAMNDDFNTPILISHLFEAVKIINLIHDGKENIDKTNHELLQSIFSDFMIEVLGLNSIEVEKSSNDETTTNLMDVLIELRSKAKENKNYALSDEIRDQLSSKGITLKDTPNGTEWTLS